MIPYYDAHTHLNDPKLYPDRATIINQFHTKGGQWLTIIGLDTMSSQLAIDICDEYVDHPVAVRATIGVHPCFVHDRPDQSDFSHLFDTLVAMSQHPHVVGIGECGTDLHYPTTPVQHQLQKDLFAIQCEVAKATRLPLVIHSRDDWEGTMDVLCMYPDLPIYMHCWWYTSEQYDRLSHHTEQLRIGLCGNVTYPKATGLHEMARCIADRHLLIETDAPYLAPQDIRWQTNTSAYIPSIYQAIARLRGVDESVLAQHVGANWTRLYTRDG